jgi:transposase
MRQKLYVKLTDSEVVELEKQVRTNPKFRTRRRSQALLWSHPGKDRHTIADLLDVRLDTVSGWLHRWLGKKLESLADSPKPGRPGKLSEDEKKG